MILSTPNFSIFHQSDDGVSPMLEVCLVLVLVIGYEIKCVTVWLWMGMAFLTK
jgi:hypothetical protein